MITLKKNIHGCDKIDRTKEKVYEPQHEFVQDLRKKAENLTGIDRDNFYLMALDKAFGITRPYCNKVKKIKREIAEIREKILED